MKNYTKWNSILHWGIHQQSKQIRCQKANLELARCVFNVFNIFFV